MRTLVLGLIVVSLLVAGCTIFGGQPAQNASNNTTAPPPPPPPKTPTFSISSPSDGQLFTIAATDNSTDVDVVLSTQNLVLKQPGGAAKKGEGYFQITVDNSEPVPVYAKSYTISALGVGNHTITVDLYNNDRSPYSPAISHSVTVDVEQEAPTQYVPQNYTVSIEPAATVGTEEFNPANLTVKVGDSVTWVNNGNIPQSATCSQGGKIIFDTKTLGPGKSATITFTDPLECDYYSSLFRAMEGHLSVVSNGTGSSASTAGSSSAGLSDCGTDLGCFANDAPSCTPAKVNYTSTLFTQTTTSYMEIRGSTGGKCDFYIRRESVVVAGADAQTQASYAAAEGKDGTCEFDPSNLAQVMQNWESGKFSTQDWAGSSCVGSYFTG